MFKLVIQDDEGKTTVVPLIRDEITIGRKEGNTIRLTERNVSRRHARILRNNGEVQIEDLGSYNGIRVNNARIAERVSLRVSDQVQIGDYKLYLKAEGVEQVDDARTMPIERVENGAPTEVMNAMTAAPTTPIPVVAAPPHVPPITTDPGGRPVATAAQVAALTAPIGYGKLVVVSSNFAGKEFELTQAQMIIGRTDDNQIVINHRSISRNHAKIIRDPESGRYTISDLQSSNGVRVNGHDYGKVELRRADEVDLGHVRLRFVEPGEDFVFARDARIADIADPQGGGRGMMLAIALGVLVLAAAGGYFLFAKHDDGGGGRSGSNVATGSQKEMIASGSEGSDQAVKLPVVEAPPIDAAEANVATGSDDQKSDQKSKVANRCQGLQIDGHWDELAKCATDLAPLDKGLSQKYARTAQREQEAAVNATKMMTALNSDKYAEARRLLTEIPDDTSQKQLATKQYKMFIDGALEPLRGQAREASVKQQCDAFRKVIQSAKAIDPTVNAKDFGTCEPKVAVVIPHPPPTTGSGSSGSAVVTPPTPCDADDLKKKGYAAHSSGTYASAVDFFKQSYKCSADMSTLKLIVVDSCKAGDASTAKHYFKLVPASGQNDLVASCLGATPAIDLR